ncbi:hypothetical protein [Deinococcus navajonensis]|uniref:Uncharacterized protein n=1 Tax=Deinococcus navajonensis TaxID=309884 RepID=A0ABV8XUH7_9DEIO
MRFLRGQAAWLVVSVLLSGVWWLGSRELGQQTPGGQSPDRQNATTAVAALSSAVTLTLRSGEVVRGQLNGAAWACPSWQTELQRGPDLQINLPDGRTVTGDQVSRVDVAGSPEAQLARTLSGSCPDRLSITWPAP